MEIEKVTSVNSQKIDTETLGIKSGGGATKNVKTSSLSVSDLSSADDEPVLDINNDVPTQNSSVSSANTVSLMACVGIVDGSPRGSATDFVIGKYNNIVEKVNNLISQTVEIKNQIESVEQKLEVANNKSDTNGIFLYQQQLFSLKSLLELREIEINKYKDWASQIEDCLDLSNKYVDNTDVQELLVKKIKLIDQLSELALKKSSAMQSEDEKAQYLLEQQENDIGKQIKEINVKLAKESAEAEGRTLSNTEISLIEKKSDSDFQIARIKEKQYYLNYKLAEIQQQKIVAEQNNDSSALYALEQQENSIKALGKIFDKDAANTAEMLKSTNESLELLQKYPNNPKIENLVKTKNYLDFQLLSYASQKSTAMQSEDKKAQYILEQQENSIYDKLREVIVDLEKATAEADGRILSNTEISLIEQKSYNDFQIARVKDKQYYLNYKLAEIQQQKIVAEQNNDSNALYALEQQENAIMALGKIFDKDAAYIAEMLKSTNESLELLQKYPNNPEIENAVKQKLKIAKELFSLAEEKSTAMQTEDEYGQYLIEQEENKRCEKLKDIRVDIEKAMAKADGRTFSSTEKTLIESVEHLKFQVDRICEKRNYLSSKLSGLSQHKSMAMQAEDEEALYILEQQENSVNSLDKIFEQDQTAIEESLQEMEELLATVQKYSDNAKIQNIAKTKISLLEQSSELAQKKSMAMQAEDATTMKNLQQEEDNIQQKSKDLEVQLKQQIAREEGKTLSSKEISNLKKELDNEYDKQNALTIRQYMSYKLIGIAQQKTTAMHVNDTKAQRTLEKQEDTIIKILSLSDKELLAKYYPNYMNQLK